MFTNQWTQSQTVKLEELLSFNKEWYKLPLVSKLKLISVVSLAFKSGVNQVCFGTDEVQSQVQAVLASILFYHFGILS